jgi:hypothetical protein
MPHAPAKDGVREQADPVQLDQDGRVPEVEQPVRDGLCTYRPCVARRVRRKDSDHELVERDDHPANATNPTVQPLTSRVAIAPPFRVASRLGASRRDRRTAGPPDFIPSA